LSRESLLRAIELNAVAVAQNQTAFEWGRHAAHDWAAVERLLDPGQVIEFRRAPALDEVVAKRVEFLTAYQNAAYAQDYLACVNKVRQAESARGSSLSLSDAVARNLFKLMAYKDEYEVARLHTDAAFHRRIGDMFEGDFSLHYHLAPPLLAKKNDKGELQKQKFGPATLTLFKVLAALKGLRGTALDVFGRSEERRQERALIVEYKVCVEELLRGLGDFSDASQVRLALDIARVPEQIKGFGHVKARNLAAARQNWQALVTRFRATAPARLAA
jgi:indolepyruvate ferredoxin oxidoreductase